MDLADDSNVFKLINKNTEIYNRADFFLLAFFCLTAHTCICTCTRVYFAQEHTDKVTTNFPNFETNAWAEFPLSKQKATFLLM